MLSFQQRQSMNAMQADSGAFDASKLKIDGSLRLIGVLECPQDAMCCRFHPDGAILAVGLLDGTVKIYDIEKGRLLHNLTDDETKKQRLPVTSIRFVPSSLMDPVEHRHLLLCTYVSGHVKFWHYTSGKAVMTINEDRQVLSCCFNHDGTRFITTGVDPAVHIYDLASKKQMAVCEPNDSRDAMNGHRMRVFACQYHPSQVHSFVTGGWDDTLQFWDDREKYAVRRTYGPHLCGDSLDIDPVYDHVLTGSWRKENPLQIWEFGSGKNLKDVPQEQTSRSMLYCAQFVGREFIVCGGCDRNVAKMIDRGTLNTVGIVTDLPQAVYSMDNSHQGANPKIAICSAKMVILVRRSEKL